MQEAAAAAAAVTYRQELSRGCAGEPISTRWTSAVKQEIKRSRTETTRKLVVRAACIANPALVPHRNHTEAWPVQACINALPKGSRPFVLVNSSAVGFYGTSLDDTFTEKSQSGTDYLSEVVLGTANAGHNCDLC